VIEYVIKELESMMLQKIVAAKFNISQITNFANMDSEEKAVNHSNNIYPSRKRTIESCSVILD